MTWNASIIDAPVPIAIYGDPITDDEGNTYRPVMGYVPGYHVNIAPQAYTAEMEPYAVTPTLPRRVFAGAETVFLRFADEAEARLVLAQYWMEPAYAA
jgi:hypothetical protein